MAVIAIPLPENASIHSSLACPWMTSEDLTCDFSDDGRLVDAVVADRSAWLCPLFYIAVPASALLLGVVVVVRFSSAAVRAVGRVLS